MRSAVRLTGLVSAGREWWRQRIATTSPARSTSTAGELDGYWLYRLPFLGPGDPTTARTVLRALGVVGAYVGILLLITVGWAELFDFRELLLSESTLRFFIPLVAAAGCMALGIYWGGVTVGIELTPVYECYTTTRVEADCRRLLRDLAKSRWDLVAGLAFGPALVLAGFYRAVSAGESESMVGGGLGAEWFVEPLLPKLAVGLAWSMVVSALVFTGTRGMLVLWRVLLTLGSAELIRRPVFVLPRLRYVVMFAQVIALAWSSYLLLFYVATFQRPGYFSLVFVGFASTLTFVGLVLPHVATHLALRRMAARFGADMREFADRVLAPQADIAPHQGVQVLAQVAVEPVTWPYDLRVVATFAALGPLASTLVGLAGALVGAPR